MAEPAQMEIARRLAADLARDEAVRGVWLTGSLGRGTADRFSDIDMLVVVAPGSREAYAGAWPQRVAHLEPLLVKRVVPPHVWAHVLPGWVRWDVRLARPEDLEALAPEAVRALVDKDGLTPAGHAADEAADAAAVRDLTEEFLRVLGLLPVVLCRGELVTAASGAGLLRTMTTSLLRLRAEGSARTGALHLHQVLPAEEIEALAALPPLWADRESAVELHLACARIFLPVAREMLGTRFPGRLERECWHHLARELRLDPPYPLARGQ